MYDPITCLAVALFFETRGEPLEGMVAVAQVIENRVDSHMYPNDICKVIKQGVNSKTIARKAGCQFSFMCDGKSDNPEIHTSKDDQFYWNWSKHISEMFINDSLKVPEITSTHYHGDYIKTPGWAKRIQRDFQIGKHIFYTEER